MEGRLLEESGWYCGGSDGRGSSERHRIRSEAGRALGGSAFYELRLGGFYTQQVQLNLDQVLDLSHIHPKGFGCIRCMTPEPSLPNLF